MLITYLYTLIHVNRKHNENLINMKTNRQWLISCLSVFIFTTSQAQYLVSHNEIGTMSTALISLLGAYQAKNGIKFYKVTYNTLDVDGNPTVASGMVVLPQRNNCDTVPVAAYCHGTVLEKDDVPSRNNLESSLGKVFGGAGHVVAMPDYLGLGDNGGLHPYMHALSEATSTIDAIRAARELMALENLVDNGQVFITGYSQGGHAAMATHKYIQDNNLQNEFNVTASAPLSGPYNMSGSMAPLILSSAPYSNPGYIIYLLMSYQLAYGNIYNNYSDILRSPYDTLIPPYFDGTYNMNTVNNLLPQVIDSYLVDTMLANFRAEQTTKNHPLWQALVDNDNYDWLPTSPVRMYYCTADEQVTFQNAIDAQTAMLANGATNVIAINRGNLTHGGCVQPAASAARIFFDSSAVFCAMPSNVGDTTGTWIGLPNGNETFKVYPNPVRNFLTIEDENISEVRIFNANGQFLQSLRNNAAQKVDMTYFPKGIYLFEIKNMEGKQSVQKIIKH